MMSDQPGAGRFEGKTHVLPVRVYYEDTDFSGIVYHASYLRFMERGRTDFLRLAGLAQGTLWDGADPCAFVVHKMSLDFLKPARVDDALIVQTRFFAKGHVRLIAEQEILRGAETLLRARVEVVTIDAKGRPRRPPEPIRAVLAPLVEPL
jgi:acyl-CoA thioester hydrolase